MTDRGISIVGIGASAGGIEALEGVLGNLRLDNAAFVVVTHQPKDRLSRLPEVLQRFTVLPVDRAFSGSVVDPNHIYVVPGSEHVALRGGRLVFEGSSSVRSGNIDHFLESLALDRGADAVGVILSGANRDGAAGLAAIHKAGGSTFVQSPGTARFAVMPKSAEQSADYSLEPAELGLSLMRLLNDRRRETE